MPELPEAETIVRTLRPRIEGRRILEARFLATRVSRDDPAQLSGQTIRHVRRYGKQIVWDLDRGCLLIKLGMTGALLIDRDRGPYTRADIALDGVRVLYDDVRQFGSLCLLTDPPECLGPDPLEIVCSQFLERIRERDTEIKALLLDQRFVRGIGNIYADEALFRAGIHPRARTGRLTRARASKLHSVIVALLEEAIEYRGSSISDYVDAQGARGGFQLRHLVYGKDGEPCARCGVLLRRIIVAQRGTHFCQRCQKR